MLKKLPKRHNVEKSKRHSGTEILIPSDNESAGNVGGAVVEVIEEVVILIEAQLGTLDLHPQDDEVHLLEPNIEVLHLGVISILTFPAIVVAVDQISDAVDHPPPEDRTRDLFLDLSHHRDAGAVMKVDHQDHGAVGVLQTDL